jgi:DNA-binding transcriptional LysR family regulator
MLGYAADAVARAVYEAGSRGWTLQHSCIRYRQAADRGIDKWEFACDDKSQRISVHGPVIVNGAEVAVRAAADGLGIAYAIESLVEPLLRCGQLIRVLEKWYLIR